MQCPTCRHVNPDAQKFCGECGTKLASEARPTIARVEASPAALGDRFHSPAAYTPKHLADKILISRAAIEGERKQVTVMFCDIANYTAFSDALDPEEVHAVLDRVFAVVLDAVHRYEGTINQFLGDGVMALFGAPIAHEDHAARALRAALALRRDLEPVRQEVRRRYGREFQIRIGLNTGLVVVGAIGGDLRMDYTAVGDTTNLAARLMAVAQPGQIVVSHGTAHPRRDTFVFEDLGEFALKGKPHPMHAFALHDEVRGRTRLEVSKARGLTAFTGREREVGRLVAAWNAVVAGNGSVVALTGEPGLGKSRLLYEFLTATQPPVALDVSCVSHGRAIPFHPVVDLLRAALGITDATPQADITARLDAQARRWADEKNDAALVLAHFLGLAVSEEWLNGMTAAHLKARTLELLRRLILRPGGDEPAVVIVENLHWIDASSDEFLSMLAEEIPRHRVLLVLTARPGTDTGVLGRAAERIVLGGLDDSSVASMVRELTGCRVVDPALLGTITANAAGNPLYMEEIIHQLRSSGGVVVTDGVARLGTHAVRVPATIHDLVAARVDRLDEPVKETLQAAAVIGREFSVALLGAVMGAPDDLPERLDRLYRADFVFPRDTDGPATYVFKHAVTQDVVYGSLLERRRRAYHVRTGSAIEAMNQDRVGDVVELLAHHFARSGDDDRAVDYTLLAAEKAQRRWAHHEALGQFEGALGRLDQMPDTPTNRLRRIDAVVKQAEVKFALGRHAEHIANLEAIHALVDAEADPPRRAAWYYWAGFLHSLTGSATTVPMAYCRTSAEIARDSGFEELGAFVNCCLTQVAVVAGELPDALGAGRSALPVFEKRNNHWWACRTLWCLSVAANAVGDWAQSLDYCARGLAYGRETKDLRLIVVGTWRTGSTHIQRGDPVSGLKWCDEALALSSAIPFDEAMIRAVRGLGLVKLGEIHAGIDALQTSIRWFETSKLWYARSVVVLWLADACLRDGDVRRAQALAAEVLDTTRRLGYRQLEGIACRILGQAMIEVAVEEGDRRLDTAIRILERAGARNDVALTMLARAEARRRLGDARGAAHLIDTAVSVFSELGTMDGLAAAHAARVG